MTKKKIYIHTKTSNFVETMSGNSYNNIQDPATRRIYHIDSQQGRRILKNMYTT